MSLPIRILHVFGALNRGGAETMIMNLYRNINKDKLQFDFAIQTKKECAYDQEIRNMGGKIYNLPRFSLSNGWNYIREWKKFFQIHKEYKIIHCHIASTASIIIFLAKKYGIDVILHSHSTAYERSFAGIIKKIFSVPLKFMKVDYYFACSKEAGEWLFGNKIIKDSKKIQIINNAIDIGIFEFNIDTRLQLRKKLFLENCFILGHVGRFDQQKNHDFLIDIFSEVCKKKENSRLILIGEGELEDKIKRKVEEYNLKDKVIFLGVQSNVYDWMSVMDIFVFPSLSEGLGMALVEAQANGLHCIASSNIPRAVNFSNLLCYVSLESPKEKWAEIILNSPIEHINIQNSIKEHGYAIEDNVSFMEEFYCEVGR